MAKQVPLTCSGHTRPVVDLAFSQKATDGYFMISACKDGKPMLRQGDTGDWVGTFLGHKGAVWAATLNTDATKAATGAADFSANLWDAVNGEVKASFQHKHIVKAVSFSPDCTRLLTGGQEKLVRSFLIEKPNADPDILGNHDSAIKKAIWSNDGKVALTASEDKTIRKWDCGSKQEVQRITLDSAVCDVELSLDGKILLVTHNKDISIYDASTFEKMREFSIPTQVYSASLHPEKKFIVAGGEDFKLYKFDFETLEELDSCKGHFGPVHIVRFSPDGELYASGSEDGTVRLWQTNLGTNYGLWKCINPGDDDSNSTT
ncbi:serine-threonine kinase receptor-associated protein-like [Clavelina lepadiformis]|uniref:Serine-threonine kinase receptor-associated protein n=1 Tax=Clavelina lepadiformis TaxID=159417 RepID=A0ABP0FXT4_CLALP